MAVEVTSRGLSVISCALSWLKRAAESRESFSVVFMFFLKRKYNFFKLLLLRLGRGWRVDFYL